MTVYYVRPTNGLDTNDGLDFFGFALSAATFTTSTKNLNETAAFAGYSFTSGDEIYISGGTGVTPGLYEIASRTDDDNIVLVADIGGTDPADVTSSDGAFKTTQKGLDTATADDTLRLCAEATETTIASIDIDTNNGTAEAPIRIEGRDGTNGSAAATYTIQAVATWGGGALIIRATTFGKAMMYKDLILDANSLATNAYDDNEASSVAAELNITYDTIRFTGGTVDGMSSNTPNRDFYVACEFDNNGGDGYASQTLNDGTGAFYYCSFHDNTVFGVFMDDAGSIFIGCEFYDNGNDGIFLQARSDLTQILDCTSYGNTGSGFNAATSSVNPLFYANCTSSGNGGYGFEFSASSDGDTVDYMDYNHTHNNTSGTTNLTGGMPGDNNQTGDPQFASVVDGSEDFTPANGSPLDSTGIYGVDIGARKAADPAGGAGGWKIVGTGGLAG